MITFAIVRHAEYKVPKDPAEFAKVFWIVKHPPLTAKGRQNGIRIAKKLRTYVANYVGNYVVGPVYHAQTRRCIEMAKILAEHGPFTKAIYEPGLADTVQAWSAKAVEQEVSGVRNLNYDWWIRTLGLEDPRATVKTEPPSKAFTRVKRAVERIKRTERSKQDKVIGLVLPSVLIQLIVGYLTGIDPAITTKKIPFGKGSITLIREDGKLLVSNAKL